jgi:hypothetical protein
VGVPASVGAPMPYWPSVVLKPETIRGVGSFYVNLILDIVFGAFALVVGISSIVAASSSGSPAAAVAVLAATGAATCGLVIVFVINFIVSLMSVFHMHHGVDEYGPEHSIHARRGVMFKWIGTTLSTAAAVLVVYLLFAGSGALFLGGSVPATAYVPLLITIFWTAGVSAKAQMYRFMVRSLQPTETRRWSDLASGLIPALGIVAIAVVGYGTVRLVDLVSNPTAVTPQEATAVTGLMLGGVFLPPGLAVAGYLIFITIYGKTRARLNQGLAALHSSMLQAIPAPAGAWIAPAPVAPPAPPSVGAPTVSPAPAAAATSGVPPAGRNFCGQCGHPLAAEALFCLNCGAPTGATPPASA